MIRFILYFILFGVIYFLIWKFFPTGFDYLVAWMTDVYSFVAGWVDQIIDKASQANSYTDAI